MGFYILEYDEFVLSENINILLICNNKKQKKNYNFGGPRELYHRFMYMASSSGRSLLTFNLPFKVILRMFEVVFWCRVRMLHFSRDWRKFIQIHQYYTMDVLHKYNIKTRIYSYKEYVYIDNIPH